MREGEYTNMELVSSGSPKRIAGDTRNNWVTMMFVTHNRYNCFRKQIYIDISASKRSTTWNASGSSSATSASPLTTSISWLHGFQHSPVNQMGKTLSAIKTKAIGAF
jgi:hypothetical protein